MIHGEDLCRQSAVLGQRGGYPRALFSQHGEVQSVSLPTDRETGRPRGFGFVEMGQADAAKAIQSLNGYNMSGRPLRQRSPGQALYRRRSSGRRRHRPASVVVRVAAAVAAGKP
ncbi:MAG: hypothetical protein U1F06_09365 [Steroidobacteraceae bacterium]